MCVFDEPYKVLKEMKRLVKPNVGRWILYVAYDYISILPYLFLLTYIIGYKKSFLIVMIILIG